MQGVALPYSRNPSGDLQTLRAQARALELRSRQLEQQKARLEGDVRAIDGRKAELDRGRVDIIHQLATIARTRQAAEGQIRDINARIQRLERSGVVR